MNPDSWFVYILRCADGSLYTGATNKLEQRVAAHNKGVASKYTRSRLPVELVWHESAADKSSALSREYEIKQLSRLGKQALLRTV